METKNAFLVYPSDITHMTTARVGEIRVHCLAFDVSQDPDEAGHSFLKKVCELL